VVVLGGFLGAGKTTTIATAAERIRARGQRVAIVTNDQASGLVDSATAREVSEAVIEIPGGCFCCRFGALVDALGELMRVARPDVILAEAVGSCTDIAATVYQPLLQLGIVPVRLGPLSIVVDGQKLRDRQQNTSLLLRSTDIAYLFERQLAEADILLLNKIDAITPAELCNLRAHLSATCPSIPLLPVSATNGDGLDTWLDIVLAGTANPGSRVLDIDYDLYAEAEARLGWVNLAGTLVTPATKLSAWATAILDGIARRARAVNREVAHIKLHINTSTGVVRGHLVAAGQRPVIIERGSPDGVAQVLVNARADVAPDQLHAWVVAAVRQADADVGAHLVVMRKEVLRPGRPVPTHRLAPSPATP
jgi:G3E family GTPase